MWRWMEEVKQEVKKAYHTFFASEESKCKHCLSDDWAGPFEFTFQVDLIHGASFLVTRVFRGSHHHFGHIGTTTWTPIEMANDWIKYAVKEGFVEDRTRYAPAGILSVTLVGEKRVVKPPETPAN
jgi:hypothetical protein